MGKALILADPGAAHAILEADLKRVGVHILGATRCEQLVQDTIRLSPDFIVVSLAKPGPELFAAAALLESLHPVAIAVFTEDGQVETIERALGSGIHSWIVRGYSVERLRSVLHLTQARFRRERRQRETVADLSRRLEERKLVDRAKGILMSSKGMAEDEAFRTLRDAAMQGKQRLGQVAQRLIDAARSAEAVNRAGQLRMLSQRIVKLCVLADLGIEPDSVEALRRASIDRLQQNFAALAELLSGATLGELLDASMACWRALQSAMIRAAQPPSLREIDDAAERLLETAERLTGALEAAGPMAKMQIVNLAGRQRMLAQRVAKIALLQGLARDVDQETFSAQMRVATGAFEDAMAALRQSPLNASKEHVTLRAAHDAWEALRRSTQLGHLPEHRFRLAQASEELLELFSELTDSYEHSLKLLVG